MHNKQWPAVWAFSVTTAMLPLAAAAADATFTTEASFVAAAGSTQLESFESLAPLLRSGAPVVTPLLSLTALTAQLGVQSAPNSPNDGFGASATDGTRYVTGYLPNQTQGTLRFDLASPSTAFGFNVIDLGEIVGTLALRTNTGAFVSDVVVANYSGNLPTGNVQYFGLTQTQAFTQVFVTITGNDDAFGIDKVSVSPVPEPTTALLLMGGLVAGFVSLRQRQRAGGIS